MKSILATFVLLAASAIPAGADVVVTLPTATTTGSVVFTEDISFTLTYAGTLGFIVFDEWVVSDGSRSAIALTTPYFDLLYSVNGGPTERYMMNNAGLIDNFAATSASMTPNDGYFGARDIFPLHSGDVLTIKAASYALPMGDAAGFNPQANQTFTGNAFIVNPFGYAMSDLTSVALISKARLSAMTSGLPISNAQGQALMSGVNTVTNDINNHLFSLRAGDGEEAANDSITAAIDDGVVVGQGDGDPDAKNPIAKRVPRSRQWEVFTTVNYGNVKLSAIGGQSGVQVDSWAPGVGIDRHLSRGLTLGFAVSFLHSDQGYTGGLGSVRLEGPALSTYLTFVRKNYWSSLLYSFGTYALDSTRNPGFAFPTAFGSTRTYTNAVQYNTGWNFRFQNNTMVTGPFAGIDYLHGTVDAYRETGGGLAALRYGNQTYQSLISRVGWSVSKKLESRFGAITPQVRLSYERQNLKNNGTSVSLINAPFTAAGGNQSPGQSYLVAGAGVNFQLSDQFNLLLTYQGQFFRQGMQAHFGAVRFSYQF